MFNFRHILYIALVLLLTSGVVCFVFGAVKALKTHEELDYGEGIVLWQAAAVPNWKRAYQPVEEYPHVVFHYPPLYHLLSRLFTRLTGDLLTAGRLVSILSLGGTCLLIAFMIALSFPAGTNALVRLLGSFCGATLVFTTPVWTWAYLMRVDTLAVLFTFSGLTLFLLAPRRPVFAFLAFTCFVAAVYTKQTMVAAPIACLLLTLIETPRMFVRLMVFTGSVGLMLLGIFHSLTDGLFLQHIIGYNLNPFFPDRVLVRWWLHASNMAGLFTVAIFFPILFFTCRVERVRELISYIRQALEEIVFARCVILVTLYFWLATAVATATVAKQGASDNYFLELDFAASIIGGLFVGWVACDHLRRFKRSHVSLEVILIITLILQAMGSLQILRKSMLSVYQPQTNHSQEVVRFIQQLSGPVYSEDMTILMQAGKEIPAEPAIISALAANGRWDESSFVRRIQEGEFEAIIVRRSLDNRERFTEAVAQAIRHRYYLRKLIGPFQIYLPIQKQ